MKQRILTTLVTLVCLYGGVCIAAQNGQDLYQQALVQERAAGNLEKAIELFHSAAKEAVGDRELVAKALIGAARCYEKLGQSRSRQLYEEVERSYPDQREQAAVARERLASTAPLAAAPLTAREAYVEAESRAAYVAGFGEPVIQLTERLANLHNRAKELVARLKPEHPELVHLRAEIAAMEEQLRMYRQRDARNDALVSANYLNALGNKQPRFDTTRLIRLKGTVKAWEFINPNVYLHLEVHHGDTTSVIYHVTGDAPSVLTQQGVTKDMIKVGDEVGVFGYRALDGSPTIGIAIVVTNGREIFLGNSLLH